MRELGFKSLKIAVSETARRAQLTAETSIREGAGTQNSSLRFPYCQLLVNNFAATTDQQNNFATRKHGQTIPRFESNNFAAKAFFFPFDIGTELHYITDDPNDLLSTIMAAGVLSASGGIAFRITAGEKFQVNVRLEIPPDNAITAQEEQSATLPEAHEMTAGIILHTYIGFIRDVSAVTSSVPVLNVTVTDEDGNAEYTEEVAV